VDLPLDDTLPQDDAGPTSVPALPEELASTIAQRPRATVEPPRESASRAEASLRAHVGGGSGLEGFITRGTLGEGGMGVVRVAEQVSLGRQVAVKTVRSSLTGDAGIALRLLREAWLAGRVEHPNVVPIHDVAIDAAGVPHIAMRRVEGVSWAALLEDPSAVRERHEAGDVLEWHLRVLVQVTHAVSCAHAKGIVHRDIKPENVMIGEFGEVYLLDWGIAVSLRPDPEGRLPLAADALGAAGTPCYMAPEMLGGSQPLIDERTDVYLLGATLHEIVTGQPPHLGAYADVVRSVLSSTPTFSPEVPPELARIVARAMSRSRTDRYASAHELRVALADFLTHRGSSALAADATARRAVLFAKLDSPGTADRQAIYDDFGAARFGYQQALKLWPGNEEARAGLELVCTRMIELELASGGAEAAHALIVTLPTPPADVARRVHLALQQRQAERERLAVLERQYDRALGRPTRLILALAIGLFGGVAPHVIATPGPLTLNAVFVGKVATALAFAGLFFWARGELRKSKMNRDLALVVLAGFFLQAPLVLACA
jgi:serine/threonine-protein kinase